MSQLPRAPNPYDPPARAEPSAARLDPPIIVRGQLNREELEHGLQLNAGQRTPASSFWRSMGILFLGILTLTGMAFIFENPWRPGGYLWFVVALGLLYWAMIIAPWNHERELDQLEQAAEEVEFVFATEGFTMHKPDCQVQTAWTALAGFRDSESLLVLSWENQNLAVARRWFADERDFTRLVIFLGHKAEMLA